MDVKLEDRDRQFVRTLQGLGSASVGQLCDELGVTATSVRQRLSRLKACGVVESEPVNNGRGRPTHSYRLTETGLRELGSNYSGLAMLLWSEMRTIKHEPTREQVYKNLKARLVSQFGSVDSSNSLNDRVSQLAGNLTTVGLDVGVGNTGALPVLQGCSCPYPDISKNDSSICELEREVFAEVLGADVELTARCVDGHSCCEFSVSEKQLAK
jgi:predicted ArsR family transcriptional regulator